MFTFCKFLSDSGLIATESIPIEDKSLYRGECEFGPDFATIIEADIAGHKWVQAQILALKR